MAVGGDGVHMDKITIRIHLNYLDELGFKTNTERQTCATIEEVLTYIEKWTEKRPDLNYEIDGIVIKVDDYRGARGTWLHGEKSKMGNRL